MNNATMIAISKDDINRIKSDFLLMNSEVPVALSRAINRALTAVNTEASVQVRKQYSLKAARVKKNFKARKATPKTLSALWQSKGRRISLMEYGAKQNKKGTSVKILVNEPRKTIDHAFINIGKKDREVAVFLRVLENGKMVPRYDIHKKYGPRIEDALAKPDVQKALHKKADDTLMARLDAEAKYILSKAGK